MMMLVIFFRIALGFTGSAGSRIRAGIGRSRIGGTGRISKMDIAGFLLAPVSTVPVSLVPVEVPVSVVLVPVPPG
jgi:hypothetical protein